MKGTKSKNKTEVENKIPTKDNKIPTKDKARLIGILTLSIIVILTGTLFSVKTLMKGDILGGILGGVIAAIILAFAIFVYIRGNRDLKEGYPLKDERSKKVIEKASSLSFFVSLYLLLGIGMLSEHTIKFRDVSQATGVAVGGMAILFLLSWLYYNRKEI